MPLRPPGSSSSSGLVALQTIRFDQAAGVANPGYINIISTETPGGSLAEADLLNQLHIANTRYGKEVSLSRTDSVSADPLMVGSNITSLTPAVFEVSTTGLREGDVIVAIANTDTASLKDMEAALSKIDKSRPVNVLFRRGEWAQYAVIRPQR